MNISRRFFLTAIAAFSARPSFPDETDHVATLETISVRFEAFDTSTRRLMLRIENSAAVPVILRSIRLENGAKAKLEKKSRFFGKDVWSEAKFLQINPGRRLDLLEPDYRVTAPQGFKQGLVLTFDFGPKGAVDFVYD